MYLKSKLDEEIEQLKKAKKGKELVSYETVGKNIWGTNVDAYLETKLNTLLKIGNKESSGKSVIWIARTLNWLRKHKKKEQFIIEIESRNYPILDVIKAHKVPSIFTHSEPQITLRGMDIKEIIITALSTRLVHILCGCYFFGDSQLKPIEVHNVAESLISLTREDISEQTVYKIMTQMNQYIVPETNNAINIRALCISGVSLEEWAILIESEKYILEILGNTIRKHIIGVDSFEFNGEIYQASKESLQIIDWVHFGTGYFSVTFNQPTSCN